MKTIDLDTSKIKVNIEMLTNRKHALNAARNTVGKKFIDKEPTDAWWRSILKARHSPIRSVIYRVYIEGVPEWVQTHLVRHHIGIEKYVTTQRVDRTNDTRPRSELPQGECKTMLMDINAEAMMNISKKRICRLASKETRYIWEQVLIALHDIDPVLWNLCHPDCIWFGFCPEMKSCGYVQTNDAKIRRYSLLEI